MPGAPVPYDALLEHAAFVRALARSLLKDDAAADDAVQETWLAATKSPPKQAGKERSWLSKVVRNAVRQQRRGAGRRARYEQEAARPEVRPTAAPATDELASRDEIFRNVADAVMALPERYRAVVMLRFYDGLPPRKIAAKLGMPVETVRTRLKRALQMLRGGLDERYGGDRRTWQAALLPLATGPWWAAALDGILLKTVALAVVLGGGLLVLNLLAPVPYEHPDVDPLEVSEARPADAPAEPTGPPVLFGRALVRGGVGAATGRVLDLQTGGPVAGAALHVVQEGAADAFELRLRARADGTFRARELPCGRALLLRAEAPGRRTRTLPPFAVEAGRVVDLGTVWMGHPGRLTGRVVDSRGAGLGAVEVEVHPAAFPFTTFPPPPELLLVGLDRAIEPLAATGTTADGAFSFDALPVGPLSLVVRARGYRQSVRHVVLTADGVAGGPVEVRVVETEPVYGRVVGGDGDPIGGARVALVPRLEMPGDFFARQIAVTDAAGRFRFDAPPPTESMRVVAAAPGAPTWLERHSGVSGSLKIVLDRGATLSLHLVDATSAAALALAQVTLTLGEPLADRPKGAIVVAGTTDTGGRVTFDVAPGDLHLLLVTHPSCGSTAYSPAGLRGQTVIDLGPQANGRIEAGSQTWTVRVKRGIRVTGTVTAPGGTPLEGVVCRTTSMGGTSTSVLTDADGRYELRASRTGPGALLVEAAGFVQPRWTMMFMPIPSRPELVRDVTMEAATRLEGRVVDDAGRALPGVETTLVPAAPAIVPTGRAPPSAITNADGRYVFDSVRPGGRVRIAGVRRGYVAAATEIVSAASDGTTRAPDLVLRPGLTVRVRVETPSGRPAADARVVAVVERAAGLPPGIGLGADGRMEARTDETGRVRVVDLPGGALRLVAAKRGFGPGVAERTLDPKQPDDGEVVLRLTEAATLRGRVVDAEDRPVVDAAVMVVGREQDDAAGLGPAAASGASLTDDEGRFQVHELPGPGRYRVVVMGPGQASAAEVADTEDLEVVLRVTRRTEDTFDPDEMREQIRRLQEHAADDPDARAVLQRLAEWVGGEAGPRGSER